MQAIEDTRLPLSSIDELNQELRKRASNRPCSRCSIGARTGRNRIGARLQTSCGVRDHEADYADASAAVLGVSPDPVAKVKKFHDKLALNFPLLADEDHAVAERYGVWVEKSMYGRKYMGNERTTFVIDAAGDVAEVLRKVKPAEHDERVLAALGEAQPPVL